MNYFFSRSILLLVIGFGAAPINALDYIFKQRNFLTNKENWLQGLIPSKHDIVEFDSTAGYAVVYIDQVLEASEIRLPDNGLIIFNDPVALGDRETWQSGDDFSETVRFQPPLPPSFFDPISWQESEKVFLHMNKVPSKKDKVIFPEEGVAQVELDARAYVNRFEYYGRNMTTQSMSRVIQCMEGQFQFLIPPNTWGKENDDGNIQRELAENPIVIQNDANLDNAPIEGLINENSRNETLSLICKHVGTCPKPQCLEPFKPFGHCCEICGAKAIFHASGFHYTDALLRTAKLLTDMGYAETHMVSLELVDKVATDFIYELVVVAKDSENYRDEIHSEIVNAMVRDLTYNMGTAYQLSIHSSNVYLSKTDRSIRISSIVFGFLVYAMIIVLCIGAYLYKTKPVATTNFGAVIRWNKSKEDVKVELETGEEVVEKLANEEEPVVEDTSEDLSSEVEEVPGDEKLIEEVSTKLAAEIMQDGLNPNFAIELEEITEERLIE